MDAPPGPASPPTNPPPEENAAAAAEPMSVEPPTIAIVRKPIVDAPTPSADALIDDATTTADEPAPSADAPIDDAPTTADEPAPSAAETSADPHETATDAPAPSAEAPIAPVPIAEAQAPITAAPKPTAAANVPKAKPPIDPRRALAIRIVAIALPLILIVAALLSHRMFIAAYIRHRAARLGVAISFDDFETGRDALTLKRARASLDGVDGVTISAASVKLAMRGSRVVSVDATDVSVAVEGSATDRVLELAAWSGDNAETYRLHGSASPIRVAWRAEEGADAWLTTSGGAFTSDGKTARFSAAASNVGGVPLGKIGAGFTIEGKVVTVEIGKTEGAEAPIVARITASPKPPRVDLTLRPVKLEALGSALGLALPAPGATASGRAELLLGKRGSKEAITGSAELLLDGYTPPHPREMSGVLAGKKTSMSTKIAVAADRSKVTLSEVVARAGRLALKGSGSITRARGYATLNMEMKGPVACSDLTRSAVRDRLGLFGDIIGDAASGAVGGSVAVTVTVEADSRDLRAAKVKHKAAVGCGLKVPGF